MPRSRRARQVFLVANRAQSRRDRLWTRVLIKFYRRQVGVAAAHWLASGEEGLSRLSPRFQSELSVIMERLYLQSARSSRDIVYEHLQQQTRKTAADIFETDVVAWIHMVVARKVVTLATNFIGDIQDVVLEAFAEGLGQEATAREIRRRVGRDYAQWKAARIARTENASAMNHGSMVAAESTGLDMVKEWAAASDARTRLSHQEADGQLREMDEPFQVGSAQLMYPGDAGGPPKEIINCRCVVLYRPRIAGEVVQ